MEIIRHGFVRVSEILSIYQNYSHVPRDKLKKAQEVGTVIHEAIEGYYKGEFAALRSCQFPYLESFLKWADKTPLDVTFQEKRFYLPSLRITGRIDLLAKINGESVLVDFKTGSWAHPEIWKLQGTFYREMIKQDWPEIVPDKYLFVQLKKDGEEPRVYEMGYEKRDWDQCERAVEDFFYFNPGKWTQGWIS